MGTIKAVNSTNKWKLFRVAFLQPYFWENKRIRKLNQEDKCYEDVSGINIAGTCIRLQ